MKRNLLWIIIAHGAVLAAAAVVLALRLPPLLIIAALAVAFAGTTVMLVAQMKAPREPGNGAAGAASGDLLPFIERMTALKNGDLASSLPISDGPYRTLALAMNEATAQLQQLARNGIEATRTLVHAGGEIEKSQAAVASATERQLAAMAEISRRLQTLASRCEEVSQLVEVLDDLARQTNVLALNAALEASRAGPVGKGFAMVADEVRKLAERSASATKDVAAFVQTLEGGTSDASRMLDDVQSLTRSLAQGAVGTAEVSSQLATAAQQLSSTLAELDVEGGEDPQLRRALISKRAQVLALLEELSPHLLKTDTPLARAIGAISATVKQGAAPDPGTTEALRVRP